jgi:hypothetical protein
VNACALTLATSNPHVNPIPKYFCISSYMVALTWIRCCSA